MHILKYILIFLTFLSVSLANEQKTIAVYVQPPIADIECASALYSVLMTKHKVRMIHHITLTEENLADVDCIAFPGGLDDADNFDKLLSDRKEIVQQFVNRGGRYLGICMGAYLADKDYFNILKNIRVEQYIKRPGADFIREESTVLPVKWYKTNYCMYFYDGAVFVGNLDKARIVATYLNRDAMAIIQDRVGLIGCHPESQLDWYDTDKLKRFWHKREHHKLLLDIVNILLN